MKVTLCADDFGLSPAVNSAICQLVANGRLNALGVMTGMKGLEEAALELRDALNKAPGPVSVGLHFTLTQYSALTNPSSFAADNRLPHLGSLILSAFTGRLLAKEIEAELLAQADRFAQVFGRKPDFLDGHQHVHTLPTIRTVVGRLAGDLIAETGFVRHCATPIKDMPWRDPKNLVRTAFISALAWPSGRILKSNNVRLNDQFYGVNGFEIDKDFRADMRLWLQAAKQGKGDTLIMCHPGLEPNKIGPRVFDPIADRRPQEFHYLMSDHFVDDLAEFDLTLMD